MDPDHVESTDISSKASVGLGKSGLTLTRITVHSVEEQPKNIHVSIEPKQSKNPVLGAKPATSLRRLRLRYAIATVFIFLFGVVILQLAFPKDHLLPFSNFAGHNVSFLNQDELLQLLNDSFTDQKVVLSTDGQDTAETTIGALGRVSVSDEDIASLYNYPLAWRFLPFSFLAFRTQNRPVALDFEPEKLEIAAVELTNNLSVNPVDATLEIVAGSIEITPESSGKSVDPESLMRQLKDAKYNLVGDTSLQISYQVIAPDTTSSEYQSVRVQAQSAIKTQFTLVVDGQTFATSETERAELLSVGRSENGTIQLSLSEESLIKFFDAIDSQTKQPAGTTVINLVDGKEVSRTDGESGHALSFESFKSSLETSFLKATGTTIYLATSPVPPTIQYNRTFTGSHAGLQAYLDSVTSGQNISVSVQQFGGNGWGASSKGDQFVRSASTYKLYLAQFIMRKVDEKQLSWNSSLLGTTVDDCFTKMITLSANNCAEHWLNVAFNVNSINSYLKSFGYGTIFRNDAAYASSDSLLKLLTNLYYRDNFSSQNANKLLGLMRQQVYRQGIPAGSSGSVADKVGFLGSQLNDAGIVYHPKGDYAIVVMTNGHSWSKIAEITRGVEKILYGK